MADLTPTPAERPALAPEYNPLKTLAKGASTYAWNILTLVLLAAAMALTDPALAGAVAAKLGPWGILALPTAASLARMYLNWRKDRDRG